MDNTRLIFHLGMPKTGTTILQHSVFEALNDAAASHLMLPRLGRGAGIAHHGLVRRLGELERGGVGPLAAELMAEIEGRRADPTSDPAAPLVVFVTSEGFTNLCGVRSADHLADFIGAFAGAMRVEALIVIRELSDFLESMYLQSARFGHMKGSFDHYLRSRRRWARNFFGGLVELQDRLGEALRIVFQDRGFDILRTADVLLDLPEGTLHRASRTLPSTAKRELKEQVALSFLERTEEALGFAVDRNRLMRLFIADPHVFEGRIERYTLYSPEARRETVERFLEIADQVPFPAYRAAFGGAERGRDAPTHALDFACLDSADFARLAAHRALIERA